MGLLGKILGIKKPKASDYKPTEAEKTQAAVASAEWQRWTTNYGGILPEISRQLQQENVRSNLRSRAGADVMQTVVPISLARTKDLGFTSDVEQARLQSLSQADTQASDFQNKAQADVLAMGQQQKSISNRGFSQLAKIEQGTALKRLADEQRGDIARANNILQIAKSVVSSGQSNIETGGSFFQPKMLDDSAPDGKRDATLGESAFSFL